MNCKCCGVLVYEIHIPSKRSGNCFRCEISRLKEENKRLLEENKGMRFRLVKLEADLLDRG